MVHLAGKTLFGPRVNRWRKRATDIAAHDPRIGGTQLRERPAYLFQGEAAALPIRHGLFRAEAIEIDRDVDIRPLQRPDKLGETLLPARAQNGATTILI